MSDKPDHSLDVDKDLPAVAPVKPKPKPDTYHKVDSQEYKVDHVNKRVLRAQSNAPVHLSDAEKAVHPDGFKYIDTNGDYDQFMAKHGAAVSHVPSVVVPVEPSPLATQKDMDQADYSPHFDDELLKTHKLPKK